MTIAQLIIDMQTVYLEEEPLESKRIEQACMYINYVAEQLRSKEQIVVHVQDVEGLTEENQASYQVIPEISVLASDLRVQKRHSNAFWQTELEEMLRSRGVELVIISGFAAEHCVLFTYNGAAERGFKPVILQNGILSAKSDIISSTYRDRNLISYPVVEFLMREGAAGEAP
ncbi:cysteine hydrolase family protein [Paenibacillus sp. CN-4]|uniref:cysteine hydrolase family protein n=1 Tax=Paenibacillus nanchangensis TaxID=3348343 RepID=UPI00397E48AC